MCWLQVVDKQTYEAVAETTVCMWNIRRSKWLVQAHIRICSRNPESVINLTPIPASQSGIGAIYICHQPTSQLHTSAPCGRRRATAQGSDWLSGEVGYKKSCGWMGWHTAVWFEKNGKKNKQKSHFYELETFRVWCGVIRQLMRCLFPHRLFYKRWQQRRWHEWKSDPLLWLKLWWIEQERTEQRSYSVPFIHHKSCLLSLNCSLWIISHEGTSANHLHPESPQTARATVISR